MQIGNVVGRLPNGHLLAVKRPLRVAFRAVGEGRWHQAMLDETHDLAAPVGYGDSPKDAVAALLADILARWHTYLHAPGYWSRMDKAPRTWLKALSDRMQTLFAEVAEVAA